MYVPYPFDRPGLVFPEYIHHITRYSKCDIWLLDIIS
jgi:hypothetical protein